MRIPVYQMTLGLDRKNNTMGLMFASEVENEDNQSIIYAVPFTQPFHHPFELIEFIERNEFYFPIEIDGKYFELKAKVEFPELVFIIPETEAKISFKIRFEDFPEWPLRHYKNHLRYKYVGKENKIIPKNNGFLIIQPIDLYELDEFYLKHKGIFVGMTPNFGEKEKLYFEY